MRFSYPGFRYRHADCPAAVVGRTERERGVARSDWREPGQISDIPLFKGRLKASFQHRDRNTLIADPIKLFTKEDFIPPGADKLVAHACADFAMVPALITFIAIPFGDVIVIAGRRSIAGGESECRHPVHPGDGLAWRVWRRLGRLGFEQPLGAPRRHSRFGANDFV